MYASPHNNNGKIVAKPTCTNACPAFFLVEIFPNQSYTIFTGGNARITFAGREERVDFMGRTALEDNSPMNMSSGFGTHDKSSPFSCGEEWGAQVERRKGRSRGSKTKR